MEQAKVNILIPIIGTILTLIVGFITWYENERSKRIYEEYKRKEEKYSKLIRSLRGFYIDLISKEKKEEFLNQLNLCWMYCPDEVIRKAYKFLLTVHTVNKYLDDEKEKAVGKFILAIRKDLINRKLMRKTELEPEDFKHLRTA